MYDILALLPLKADLQLDAANLIVKQGLSVRQTEALAKRLSNPKEERKPTNDELTGRIIGERYFEETICAIEDSCDGFTIRCYFRVPQWYGAVSYTHLDVYKRQAYRERTEVAAGYNSMLFS